MLIANDDFPDNILIENFVKDWLLPWDDHRPLIKGLFNVY